MLILRLTVTCAFLIAFSFFITSSSAHNPTVVVDSTVGGEFPSRQVALNDRHSAHPSISARAGAKKTMKSSGVEASANGYVSATQTLVLPNGNVGTPYGHWQIYAKVTDGVSPDEDCGDYSGYLSKGGADYTQYDIDTSSLSNVSASGSGNVYNQISQTASCSVSL